MSDPGETTHEAAERGFVAGQIDARLAGHDKHFADINGSIGRLADEVHVLNLNVQRLADDAKASARTVITTAAALKEASEKSWTPFQRGLAIAAVLAAVVGLFLAYGR